MVWSSGQEICMTTKIDRSEFSENGTQMQIGGTRESTSIVNYLLSIKVSKNLQHSTSVRTTISLVKRNKTEKYCC
jgi:hypothetical protein